MNIYDDYIATIKSAMLGDQKSGLIVEGKRLFDLNKSLTFQDYKSQIHEDKLLPSLEEFTQELSLVPNFNQSLGLHPDFGYLKNSNKTEQHYIVSMFVDIKGSTNLFKRYNPKTVLTITHTIQRAAIHTNLIFGGYIHRLHGDGLFVYYGGKKIDKSTSVLRSLQSSSVFTYFVKNDLKNLFSEQGIDNIFTRIGIDLGDDQDVIWSNAGIGDISEVTTCSLHTSLASKMQGYAQSNGIVIGDNIKNNINSLQNYFEPVSKRTNNEKDRYIFQIPEENFNYTQYDFNWLNFLKNQDFIVTDLYGNLTLKKKLELNVKASENLKPIASLSKPYFHN